MALSASHNSMRSQKKGTSSRQTARYKGRCHHCGKWGHKKEHCREWLQFTKEQQDQADKEKSEQKPKKYSQHVRCYTCNKLGHIMKDCPEKKFNDSSGGSSGGFAMMCIEGTKESKETHSEPNSEKCPGQRFQLQDWMNQEAKSNKTEYQSCIKVTEKHP